MLALGGDRRFATLLLGGSTLHHVLMYLVFRRVYQASLVRARWAAWYPVANVVVDLILVRALAMCFTGKVTWRGTDYSRPATPVRLEPAREFRPG
jgi:hypothetical protein